jgi:hypothetical protein
MHHHAVAAIWDHAAAVAFQPAAVLHALQVHHTVADAQAAVPATVAPIAVAAGAPAAVPIAAAAVPAAAPIAAVAVPAAAPTAVAAAMDQVEAAAMVDLRAAVVVVTDPS